MVKKATYRRFDRIKNKEYTSCIDTVYIKNLVLDGFKHLNLPDEIKTDGHLGQLGHINFDINFAQIKKNELCQKACKRGTDK